MGLSSDESALTGESVPAKKEADCNITDEKTPLAERYNMLYSGNYITSGYCKALLQKLKSMSLRASSEIGINLNFEIRNSGNYGRENKFLNFLKYLKWRFIMKKYDVVILGSGPAGRHTCSELKEAHDNYISFLKPPFI